MFTGIVNGKGKIVKLTPESGRIRYAIQADFLELASLAIGASVSVDGTCLTVTDIENGMVWFDAIPETLNRTTLVSKQEGDAVNIERSARMGDEIGGHILSGHIGCIASVISVTDSKGERIVRLSCPAEWHRFLFTKGYVALNGCSLTLVEVDRETNEFSVHLIPETLRLTTFSGIQPGDGVNLEVDSQTQAVVETVERVTAAMGASAS